MRRIVVVLVQTMETKMAAGKLGDLLVSRFVGFGFSAPRELHIEEPWRPLFWTWFIENPRGSRLS
jgi:hypothetical protein